MGRARPCHTSGVRPDDLDWDLTTALRRQRPTVALFTTLLVAGVAVAAGWSLAGMLLAIAGGLGLISRVLTGMLKTPGDR